MNIIYNCKNENERGRNKDLVELWLFLKALFSLVAHRTSKYDDLIRTPELPPLHHQ